MTYLISIDLLPNIGTSVDLGTTPCEWHESGCLQFLDAPYELYDYISDTLGYDASDDASIDKQFSDMFFTTLNNEIRSKGGLSDNLQFTMTLPKFFHIAFNINVFVDTE